MNHSELHRALQGPEYSAVSLDVADLQGNAQTISVLRSPPKTSQISWARAVKPLRDRRRELQEIIRGLTKGEERESASLSMGEATFVRLWPKLRAHGFHTFDTMVWVNWRPSRSHWPFPQGLPNRAPTKQNDLLGCFSEVWLSSSAQMPQTSPHMGPGGSHLSSALLLNHTFTALPTRHGELRVRVRGSEGRVIKLQGEGQGAGSPNSGEC